MNGIALFQAEVFGALPGDHALNYVLTHFTHDSGHDLAQVDLFDRTRQLVSCGEFHVP